MGMSVGAADEGGVMVEMNTTPLIDVMLVLLIMFIMSLPVQTHAVKLDMPRPNQNTNPPAPPVVHTVEVDFDGTVIWDGNVTQNLAQVTRYLASVAAGQPQPEVHLRPHRLAKYDTVAKILAIAQRLGVKKIGFVGNEQFLNQ
ncbi:MAG: biopolymer transporter ExbD [Rhodospirillaceae bacterium]|nr:biopolymer transporter ExbD [Rhodospirillaceae bacterium]